MHLWFSWDKSHCEFKQENNQMYSIHRYQGNGRNKNADYQAYFL